MVKAPGLNRIGPSRRARGVAVPDVSNVSSVSAAAARDPGVRRANAEDFGGGIGRALEGAGQDVADIGQFLHNRERQRESAEADIFASETDAALTTQASDLLLRQQSEAPEKPTGLTQSFLSEFDRISEERIKAAPSAQARRRAQEAANRVKKRFGVQARVFEHNQVVAGLTREIGGELETLRIGAFRNPEIVDELFGKGNALIDQGVSTDVLPETTANRLEDTFRREIYASAVRGLIEQSPGLAQARLESGEFDELIGDVDVLRQLSEEAEAGLAGERRETRALAQRVADNSLARVQLTGRPDPGAATTIRDLQGEEAAEAYARAEERALFRKSHAERLKRLPPGRQEQAFAALTPDPNSPTLAQDMEDLEAIQAEVTRHNLDVAAEQRVELKEVAGEASDAVGLLEVGLQPPGLDELKARLAGIGSDAANETLALINRAEQDGQSLRAFTALPLAQQQERIHSITSQEEISADELEQLGRLQKAHTALLAGLDKDPFGTAARFGVIEEVVEVDFNDPASMQARKRQADRIATQYGIEVPPPLSLSEARSLEAAMDGATAGQVTGLLASLQEGFGEDGTQQIAGLFKEQRPAFETAIAFSTSDPLLAVDIVDGDRSLKENPDLKADPNLVEESVASIYGDFFANHQEARPRILATAQALYAKSRLKNPNGIPEDQFEVALRRAAGATLTRDGDLVGGPIEFRGGTILPPTPTTTEDDLSDIMDSLNDEALVAFGNGAPLDELGRPVSAEDIRDHGRLVFAGDGHYAINLDGTGNLSREGATREDPVYILDLGRLIEVRGTTGATPRLPERPTGLEGVPRPPAPLLSEPPSLEPAGGDAEAPPTVGQATVRASDALPQVEAALERFPRLQDFPFIVQRRGREGDEPRIESFPPDEARNPNPGTRTLELRGEALRGRDLENAIVGDMLHHLGSGGPDSINGGRRPVNDPEFRALKDRFIEAMPGVHVDFARQRYQRHREAFPEDQRSFEDWFDTVWADMWLGGLIAPINDEFTKSAPTALAPEQIAIVDEMKQLLRRRL